METHLSLKSVGHSSINAPHCSRKVIIAGALSVHSEAEHEGDRV
jgi:hypothetical protein